MKWDADFPDFPDRVHQENLRPILKTGAQVDIKFHETIQINRPVAQVYAYLDDFSRHVEWAQTVAQMEQVKTGDSSGVGAQYRTQEKQAMQHDRKPRQKLTKGLPAVTLCTVDELSPNRRIRWHAHSVPKMLHNKLEFSLASDGNGGTKLTQLMDFHIPAVPTFLFRLLFGGDLQAKATQQGVAGLENIKLILEGNGRSA